MIFTDSKTFVDCIPKISPSKIALNKTEEKWDAPNGWAPLQWITIKGLRNYNQSDIAERIKKKLVFFSRKKLSLNL